RGNGVERNRSSRGRAHDLRARLEDILGPSCRGAPEFWRAVEGFSVADLPLVIRADAERRLQSCLTGGGPILLGESHGAAENPLVILTLMHRFGVRVLALEWPPELEPAVQRYLEGGALDFRMFEGSSDGRITAGHMAVLRKLHDEGGLERLVLF